MRSEEAWTGLPGPAGCGELARSGTGGVQEPVELGAREEAAGRIDVADVTVQEHARVVDAEPGLQLQHERLERLDLGGRERTLVTITDQQMPIEVRLRSSALASASAPPRRLAATCAPGRWSAQRPVATIAPSPRRPVPLPIT
jgi:hypothetical protein